MKKVRMFIYILLFFIFRPLVYILPFRVYLELIKSLSSLASPFFNQRKQLVKKNLLMIKDFPIDQINSVLQEGVKNILLKGFLDYSCDRWGADVCKKYVVVEGKEHLLEALAEKKGVLIPYAHSNTQVIALSYLGQIERMNVIGINEGSKRFSIPSFHARIRSYGWESTKTMKLIYVNKEESLREKLGSLLKAGKPISTSADGLNARKFFLVPFFNKKIKIPTGFFKLSTLFNAPIVPLFSGFDRKKNILRIWLGPPILLETPEKAAEAFWAQLQNHLKRNPLHWTGWWRMKLIQDEKGEEYFSVYSI